VAHSIAGFVAKYDSFAATTVRLPDWHVCGLNLGFAFVPLPDREGPRGTPFFNEEFLEKLTTSAAAWAAMQSRAYPIAYIKTEYFGGTGTQVAVVWQHGIVSFGPVATGEDAEQETSLSEGAINRAVRLLGVERGKAIDEFAALGLQRYRSNDDWIAFAAVPSN
jgi:hypothetical protein